MYKIRGITILCTVEPAIIQAPEIWTPLYYGHIYISGGLLIIACGLYRQMVLIEFEPATTYCAWSDRSCDATTICKCIITLLNLH